MDAMLSSPFFGLALSAAAWCGGVWLQKKTKWVLCNPLLVASLVIIALLAVFGIPLEDYNQGGDIIKMMLGPVTAVLALNIYYQRQTLKEYFVPVLVGCLAGSAASLGSVLALCHRRVQPRAGYHQGHGDGRAPGSHELHCHLRVRYLYFDFSPVYLTKRSAFPRKSTPFSCPMFL